jgi:hypothetical protein
LYVSPVTASPQTLADEAELRALSSGSNIYSLEDLRTALRQYGMSTEEEEGTGAERDERLSLLVDDAARELERRASLLGTAYPFVFERMVLIAGDGAAGSAYVFLLLMTALSFQGRRTGLIYFEEIVARALAEYIGGEYVRFGWPRRDPVPRNPEQAVDYLAERLGEQRTRGFPVRLADKDMGLDVAAWKHFPDRRRSKIVILGQCATGSNWKGKIGELNLTRWRNYINFNVKPTPVFAIPWTLDDDTWDWVESFGVVVFDRIRATFCLCNSPVAKEVRRWCRAHLAEASEAA